MQKFSRILRGETQLDPAVQWYDVQVKQTSDWRKSFIQSKLACKNGKI